MTELEKIQNKIKDLQEKLTSLESEKNDLEKDLFDHADDETKAENIVAMISNVDTKIKVTQTAMEKTNQKLSDEKARLSSDEYKKQVKVLEKLKKDCDNKKDQIIQQAIKLVDDINTLEKMTDEHYRVHRDIGGNPGQRLSNNSDYRRAWIVKIELEKWLKVWKAQDRFRANPEKAKGKVGPVHKGPQWDDVMAMRYRDPDKRPTEVRLLKNDPGKRG